MSITGSQHQEGGEPLVQTKMNLWFKLRESTYKCVPHAGLQENHFQTQSQIFKIQAEQIDQLGMKVAQIVLKNNPKDNGYSGTQYNPSIQEVEAELSSVITNSQ